MNKSKKTIASIVLACQALTLTAGAATIDSVSLESRNVTVSGTTEEKSVTYKVYSKSTDGKKLSDICEMGEAKVTDGEFLIEIKMPEYFKGEETDGEYVVTVMGEDSDSAEFLYIAYSSQTDFVKTVNDIKNGKDLVELFVGTSDAGYDNFSIMEILGVDVEYYKGLDGDEQENLANAFLAESKGNATADTFSSLFELAKTIQQINKNGVSEQWLEEAGIDFNGVTFDEVEDEELKEYILNAFEDVETFSSYSQIEKLYREVNVLYLINDAKYTEYDDIISKYDDIIEITKEDYYEDYLDMKASNQKKVNSKVKNEITDKKVSSAEDFRKIYEDAVEEVIKESKKSSSSGGGGGGSSSGNGMSIIVPEVQNPTTEQKPAEDEEFADLGDVEWAKTAIKGLAKKGVVAGYEDKTYKPNKKITREEFIKMVVAAQNISLDADACGFSDVDQKMWYAPYVNAAYKAGIISGVSESEFGIGKEITREDMAVIIARIKNYDGEATQNAFADDDSIASYAKGAVYGLYKAGKIAGVGENMFGPKQIVNRAQAAKIIFDTLISGM